MALNELDRVEILSLQDNYIEITAMDDNDIVRRARNVRDGEICNSIGAEHGFSAIVRMTREGRTRTLLFDFGFSEHGTATNADALERRTATSPGGERRFASRGFPGRPWKPSAFTWLPPAIPVRS